MENTSDLDESYNLLVASMGGILEEGDLSLHFVKTNKKLEVLKHEILKLNERIRDMKYVPSLNKVFLFFDTSAAIGVLTLE